ncbi:MAG: TrbI/VirB10 family protein [Acidobacteria bacterium]|nr:TrbI/VirB10 family protein [Acidobacteriota bacterium]
MEFNKLVVAGLSIGCLAAAAGGSYLAVRQNQAAVSAAPDSPARAVTESEGVIAPEGVRPADPVRQAPAVSSKPTNSRIANAPTRRPSTPDEARDAGLISRSGQTPESPAPPAAPTASGGSMWESRPTVEPSVPEYVEPEPPPPPPPPVPEFVDVTVPSDAVLGLQIERTVSSELARVEDKVDARVTRDVRIENRIAIPAGSTVRGSVIEVDKGGRMKGKARLAIRFHTLVLADGTQLSLKSDPVVREGQSPGGQSAAKIGGAAIGGAILGAILGGGKGAATGAAVGAGAGTAAAMSNDRNPATLSAGTTVTVRMQAPVTVTVQKE